MRVFGSGQGLAVRVTAGTHTVLLGWDLGDPVGCLGFGVHRTDHTEDESYWLRGLKVFPSVVPKPAVGMDFSLRDQPVQGFQWGDYTAKPEHDYTYRVVAWGGTPGALTTLAQVEVEVRTEAEDDGRHGVWFNRGVAGSQAYVKRFGTGTPTPGTTEGDAAFAWLSRGLGEAFTAFAARADGPEWGLRGAFYEFTWATGLGALAAAAKSGADVQLVVHGRDKDGGEEGGGDTAAQNRAAVTAAGLDDVVTWRTAPNKGALQHNKFLVLTRGGAPVAVWTGSTNLTQGAVFGHLNVGHLVTDAGVAQQFLDYWAELADQANTTALMRTWDEAHNPADIGPGLTTILSPRRTTSPLLTSYADAMDAATSSSHITGAFGLNAVFRQRLATDRDLVRTVLLDKKPPATQAIPTTDPDVRVSWGDYLHKVTFERWAAEHLTGFNEFVKFIHTKIILIDPMTATPTTLTGSANYSDNSTTDNEENTVVIGSGGGADSDAAARRVADIYLTEYQRLFMHFVFRDWAAKDAETGTGGGFLTENDTWTKRYYEPGSWRARQRSTFAAPA